MYVNPFLAGVLTTIFVELVILFIASMILVSGRRKK